MKNVHMKTVCMGGEGGGGTHVCLAFTFDVWCMRLGQVMTGKSNSECFLTFAANLSKLLMPTSQHYKHHITLQFHGSWCTD